MKGSRTEPDEPARQGGVLYVVATPIGNLEDITLRAIRILQEVALVAAEDTRHTRKLLSHLGIRTPLLSYYKEKEAVRSEQIMEVLSGGRDVALVSDAGTPAISDPGNVLVDKARQHGIRVIAVPGPSALTAAVSIAGFPGAAFLFLGFLPAKTAERRKVLAAVRAETCHIVFYDSPRRVVKSLADCLDLFGDRRAFVARELTKLHEESITASLSAMHTELAARQSLRGEFVVMVEGAREEERLQTGDIKDLLIWCRDQAGLSLRDAVKRVARDMNLSRSEVYRKALEIWD